MFNIIFYEDDFYDEENVMFCNEIEIQIPDVRLHKAGSIAIFENLCKNYKVSAFILDIMGAEYNQYRHADGKKLLSSFIGIDLLIRIRDGLYPKQDIQAPVIMRSARAYETKIEKLCKNHGATALFSPGREDDKIIELLNKIKND